MRAARRVINRVKELANCDSLPARGALQVSDVVLQEACPVSDPATHAPAAQPSPDELLRCDARIASYGGVLALAGELDMSTVAEVDAQLAALCEQGVRRLVVDLRRLEFIDSTGLRLLVTWLRRGQDGGPPLAVVPGPSNVQRVLEIAGLDTVLDFVAPAEADA